MRAALEQAQRSLAAGNLPIVAVIEHAGQMIAAGRGTVDSGKNDTHHAELRAMQSAAGFLFAHKRECTIYTILEPSMMCLGAIVNVGILQVVFAATDRYLGATGLVAHGEYYRSKRLQFVTGVLAAESQVLLNEYVQATGFRAHLSTLGY
jgi:tRNA(adenine34) deaminase